MQQRHQHLEEHNYHQEAPWHIDHFQDGEQDRHELQSDQHQQHLNPQEDYMVRVPTEEEQREFQRQLDRKSVV